MDIVKQQAAIALAYVSAQTYLRNRHGRENSSALAA